MINYMHVDTGGLSARGVINCYWIRLCSLQIFRLPCRMWSGHVSYVAEVAEDVFWVVEVAEDILCRDFR